MKRAALWILAGILLAFAAWQSAHAQSYREITVQTSTTKTSSGSSSDVDTGADTVPYKSPAGMLLIDIGTVTGTSPSMIPKLYCKDSANELYPLAVGEAITVTGTYALYVPFLCKTVRGGWDITRTTPSFNIRMTLIRY